MNPFVIAFRRIIYSIPLKRLLVGLAVFGVLFACTKAEFYCSPLYSETETINKGYFLDHDYYSIYIYWDGVFDSDTYCLNASYNSLQYDFDCNNNYSVLLQQEGICVSKSEYSDNGHQICIKNNDNSINFIYGATYFSSDCLNKPYTSLQCQTEYNLIPISSVDQNYCTTNNLCPAGGSSDCPNVGISNLYINDIFHPGAFNIIMNIPEEIDWDYAYTNSGQNFNLDVVGYNQDFEKIEGWINTNNYKPSSEDFTNIFTGGFSNFGGLLVAALFVILVFYFVKKMFK